jgi:membrane-bound lytic murein transglycosylase B
VIVALEQPVEPACDEFKQLLERGIKPHITVAAIRRTGVSPAELAPDDALVSVFAAETDAGTRYWLAFNNFYVITRYNRSVNYALAVHELALELRRMRDMGRLE